MSARRELAVMMIDVIDRVFYLLIPSFPVFAKHSRLLFA